MPYRLAAIDVHKKVLMVVVADVTEAEFEFEARRFGTTASELRRLAAWLQQQSAQEAVMESTAQYWKPVWQALEPHMRLHLAQAYSNRAPHGRKHDFADAKRLLRRLVAGELILSFVPEPEQRAWRTMTRMKCQLTRDRVRLQNQVEALLEEMRIKLSSLLSDLLGVSGRRILQAIAEGVTEPAKLALLGDEHLRCTKAQLADALTGQPQPMHRQLLRLYLQRLELIDQQIETLNRMIAQAMKPHQDAVVRLAEVPGFGVDSAQQAIAEVGPQAKTFDSAGRLSSWVGSCPGREESAGENHNNRSAKGNKYLRRILNQAAHAAVKTKGSVFQAAFRRLLPRLGYNQAIWAIAHRLCRLVWKILHDGVRYVEFGEAINPEAQKRRVKRMVQTLRKLGYEVQLTPASTAAAG